MIKKLGEIAWINTGLARHELPEDLQAVSRSNFSSPSSEMILLCEKVKDLYHDTEYWQPVGLQTASREQVKF